MTERNAAKTISLQVAEIDELPLNAPTDEWMLKLTFVTLYHKP